MKTNQVDPKWEAAHHAFSDAFTKTAPRMNDEARRLRTILRDTDRFACRRSPIVMESAS